MLNALLRIDTTPLWDQDEAAYAGFARHMVQSGDWVVPQFMWSAAHRKPPLLLWGIASAFKMFGESELALRLPTVLATLLTFLALWRFGAELFGEQRARFAAIILATSVLLPNMGKIAFPDCWLLLFETVAPLALLHALERPSWKWTLVFWSAVALGTLTKGPPILILSGGLFVWLAVFHPQRARLLRLQPWFGLPLALLPLFAWGWVAWHRTDGALIRWMLDWYIFRRAKGGTVFGQIGPPGYHLIVMFAGLLPWSAFLWTAIGRVRSWWQEPHGRFLAGWLLFGWGVWELLPSKLPAYAIGAYPAVALLLAAEVERPHPWLLRSVRVGTWIGLVTGLLLAFGMGLIVVRLDLGWVAGVGATLIASTIVAGTWWGIQSLKADRLNDVMASFAFGGALCSFFFWLCLMPALDGTRGVGRAVAEAVRRVAHSDSRVIFSGDFHLPSMPFYIGREHSDESVVPENQLEPLLKRRSDDVYVVRAETFRRLQSSMPSLNGLPVSGWNVDGPKFESYVVFTGL